MYEGRLGPTLVIRTATEADYAEGDDILAATYELQEDGLVRLEIPVFGTTQVAYYELTDLGLQEVTSDVEETLFNRANSGCGVLVTEVERLRGVQRARRDSWGRDEGYIVSMGVDSDATPRNGVDWGLTGVPDLYWIVGAIHDECQMAYRHASHDSDMRGFTDFDETALEEWFEEAEATAAAERERRSQQAAAERAARAAAAEERARVRRELVANSKERRETYGTFTLREGNQYGDRETFTAEVTDVSITGVKPVLHHVEETGNPADVWWFCHLSSIEPLRSLWAGVRFHGRMPDPRYGRSDDYVNFSEQWTTDSMQGNEELAETVEMAFSAWKAKFGRVKSEFNCKAEG